MRDKVVLSGHLNFLGLGDIMQLLGANSSTGVLRLISRYAPDPAFIYFESGNPINSSCGTLSGLDAVYSLFGWTEGEFEFTQETVASQKVITKSRMGIILEGLKMVDDGQVKKVGPEGPETQRKTISSDTDAVPTVRGPLVDYMYVADEEDFFDGEYIVEEGKHGSWIWVVLEGVVEIIKQTPKGALPILRIGDGSFIGSLSTFLIQGNVRTASAVAVGNVQLGVLDSQRLAQEFAALTPDFRNFLTSIDKRMRQLNERIVAYFEQSVDVNEFLDNKKPVIKQGTEEDHLYLVTNGNGAVLKHTEGGRVPLTQLYKGDYFGRIPFLEIEHEPEYASVMASPDFKVRKVDASLFQKEYQQLSTTFKNIVDNMATSVAVTTSVVCQHQKKYGSGKY